MKKIFLALFSILLIIVSFFKSSIITLKAEESPVVIQEGVTLNNLIDHPRLETFRNNYSYIDGDDYYSEDYQLLASRVTLGGENINFVTKYEKNISIKKEHVYFFYFEWKHETLSDYNATLLFSLNEYEDETAGFESGSFSCFFNRGDLNDSSSLKLNFSILLRDVSIESYEMIYLRNIMLFDLTESYGENIPNSDDLRSFFQTYGFIDSITFDSTGIIGPSQLITYTNDTLLTSDILSCYSHENYDLYISFNNYSAYANQPGNYPVTISYKNYFEQLTSKDINILVIDRESPVITLRNNSNTIEATVSNPLTIAEIISYIVVTDNAGVDLSSGLTIDANGYLSNATRAGRYFFDVYVVDNSGNESYKRFYINVTNDLGPIVHAPSVIYKSKDIVFNTSDVLDTVNSIVDQDGKEISLYVKDELNSDNVKIINDTFTGNANKEGTYIVTLLIWDNIDRKTYHTFTIHVLDDVKNFVMYNNTIYLGYDVVLSQKDIVNILNRCKVTDLNSDNSVVTFPLNEYEQYSYAAGQVYQVKVRFKCANGIEEVHYLNINVSNEKSYIINSGFFAKLGRAFSNFWDDWGTLFIWIIVLSIITGIIIILYKKGHFKKLFR